MYKYYYVYILRCSDGSYYTGVTNNINHRINQHNDGQKTFCYTYSRRPVVLVYYEEFVDVDKAIAREKQLKGWRREKKEALIFAQLDDLPQLAKLCASRHPSTGSG
ncbi:MAG: GIY-YIG nuclease family protein [Candidatus Falkowbacteria bacterium]